MKAFRIVTAGILCAWAVFIFIMSSQTAEKSSAVSGGLIEWFLQYSFPDFQSFSVENQTALIETFQFLFRKTAHFMIYGVLGVFSFLTFVTYQKFLFRIRLAISSLVCLTYAITDEIHQIFVAGRSGELRDVMIDFLGALLGILLLAAFVRLIQPLYRKVRYDGKEK